MTDTTAQSFAYRLFQFIRGNKKALIAELPPASLSNSDGYEQREALRRLINAMFQFEKFCRGAQQALAGVTNRKHFTVTVKRPHRTAYGYHVNFVDNAAHMAAQLVRLMLDCQNLLVGPTWQAALSIEGMANGDFNKVARRHVDWDRLPKLVNAFTGFLASYEDTGLVKLTFTNGAAVNQLKQVFAMPTVEGKTLEEQIVCVNSFWTKIKQFVREAAKDPKNWPTLDDSRNVEVQSINDLLAGFYRGLRPEQKALFRKYPDEANRFFSSTM